MLQRAYLVPAILACQIWSISGDFKLTVLHTNDVHARFEETSEYGGPCHERDSQAGKCYGGIARRMTMLRHFRNTPDHVILLDAGDQFQGTLWFFIHKGNAAAHFMNLLKYDVMVSTLYFFVNFIENCTRPYH